MGLLRKLQARLVDYSDASTFASKLRIRRSAYLKGLITRIAECRTEVKILDIGGTRTYWMIMQLDFLREHNVRISVLNLPGAVSEQNDDIFSFIEGDGCSLAFDDNTFDLAHSNSVIEHVGRWMDMLTFAHELRRVAPSYYVQTPYFWFPIEPHLLMPFFHWLPEPVRVSINMRFAMAAVKRPDVSDCMLQVVDGLRLLDQKMLRALLPDAVIYWERFLFLRKSMIAIREKV